MSVDAPDWLLLNGRRRMLQSFPLEAYVRSLRLRPDFRLNGTGHRRGYVASWEIREDDTLWLTGLQTRPDIDGPDPGLRVVFPDSAGPASASWVHQSLFSPDSPRFNPMGYSTTFAFEMHLHVWAGRLISIEELQTGSKSRVQLSFTSQLEAIFGAEEASFLRAIATDPVDFAPRLIYADWLDEREDPRASLVRINESLRAMNAIGPTRLEPETEIPDRRKVLWRQLLGYDNMDEALR